MFGHFSWWVFPYKRKVSIHPNNLGYLDEKVWDLDERVWVSTPPEEGAGPSPNLTRGPDDNP